VKKTWEAVEKARCAQTPNGGDAWWWRSIDKHRVRSNPFEIILGDTARDTLKMMVVSILEAQKNYLKVKLL
jgi:hypothetical protein